MHKNFSFSLSSNGLLWYKRTFYGTNGLDVRPGPSVIFDGLRTGLGLEFLGPVRVRSEVRRADPGGLSVAADSMHHPTKNKIDLTNLSEFRSCPSNIAPKGNVGTPTRFFLQAINECRLSPKVIAKLGLNSCLRNRGRKFSAVAPPKDLTHGGEKLKNPRNVPLNIGNSKVTIIIVYVW